MILTRARLSLARRDSVNELNEHRAVRRSTLSSPPTRHRDGSRERANDDAREGDDAGRLASDAATRRRAREDGCRRRDVVGPRGACRWMMGVVTPR